MAGKKREKIRQQDITGLKFFDILLPMFERLHDVGCQRDKAGNRKLHFDQYCMLILLFLFNPIVTSLRALQQASELKSVRSRSRLARRKSFSTGLCGWASRRNPTRGRTTSQ